MQNRETTGLVPFEATLFGVPSFVLDGRPVGLSGRKNRALLSVLALAPGVFHSRDRLVGLLWPRSDEYGGRANLRQALSTIRAALGDSDGTRLVADRSSVALNAPAMNSDVLRLETFARNAMAEPAGMPEIGGSFLEGLSGFSSEFDTWRATEEARLSALAASVLKDMAERAAARNELAEAIGFVSRALGFFPLDEPLTRLAMRLHVQQGQSARALEQFRLLRHRLEAELGVPPERATLELAHDIQARRHRGTGSTARQPDPRLEQQSDLPARPETRYARAGDLNIAYQVSGSGPIDLIYVQGWITNVELAWENRDYARFLHRLGTFARVIRLDKRGTGLSDRNVGYPELEERMEDLRAVMDAAGSTRAVLMGTSEGGNLCMLFAAAYPQRTAALILFGGYARGLWAADYPWAKTVRQLEKELESIERDWGGPFELFNSAPSIAAASDESFWFARYLRQSASPVDAVSLWRWSAEIDMRSLLSTIHVPCLVLHRTHDRWVNVAEGRYLADRIEGAAFVEFPGEDHLIWAGDTDVVLDRIESWLSETESRPVVTVLITCLYLECAGYAVEVDLDDFDRCARREAATWGASVVHAAPGAILLAMPGPSVAIRCADAIRRACGVGTCRVRAGVHVGECDRGRIDLDGELIATVKQIAVQAAADQILVSQTVRGILSGPEIVLNPNISERQDGGTIGEAIYTASIAGRA